jgi:hypothetical protein
MLSFGTRTVQEQIPLECVCDRCGKKITPEDFIEWEEKLLIRFIGGYGSLFGDEAHVECDLCQSCLHDLISPFCRHV